MAATASTRFSDLSRAISVRQVRLVCGVILFAYVVSHFLNHALGNISVDAMEIGVYYHMLFWQFLPVAIVFYTAALTHMGLGIYRCISAGSSVGGRSSRCSSCWA